MFSGLFRFESLPPARSTSDADGNRNRLRDWTILRGVASVAALGVASGGVAPGGRASGGGSRRRRGRRPGYMREQEDGGGREAPLPEQGPLEPGSASHPPPHCSVSQGGHHYCHCVLSVCSHAPSDKPLPHIGSGPASSTRSHPHSRSSPTSLVQPLHHHCSGPAPSDRPLLHGRSGLSSMVRPLPHTGPGPAPSDRPLLHTGSSPAPSARPLPHSDCSPASSVRPLPLGGVSRCDAEPATGEQFTSSFSFIQQSLTPRPRTDSAPASPPRDPSPGSALPVTMVADSRCVAPAGGRGRTPELKDLLPGSRPVSADSSDSCSSLTSGYESAAPCGRGNTRMSEAAVPSPAIGGVRSTNTQCGIQPVSREAFQIEAAMSKLRRSRQNGILQDYDTERMQRENTLKYIELLEHNLHSYGNSLPEHVWEADLEACRLLSVMQEATPTQALPTECTQDSSDLAAGVVEVTESCKLIGRRLESLEEQLWVAILNQSPALIHSLEEEVQEVKATLQAMRRILEEVEEDDTEDRNGEEDEDHYLSDSWMI